MQMRAGSFTPPFFEVLAHGFPDKLAAAKLFHGNDSVNFLKEIIRDTDHDTPQLCQAFTPVDGFFIIPII